MSNGLFSLGAYVSAVAYSQAHVAGTASSTYVPPAPEPPARNGRSYAPSVYFGPADASHKPGPLTPYRSLSSVRFEQSILPQSLVDYLLNQALLTGQCHSLFRHGPATAPEFYEVRPGSPAAPDRSTLGGEDYDAQEELFFHIAWVAHVHPLRMSPLPSWEDLEAIGERARLSLRRHTRHVLFGFHGGEPVSVDMQALYDPLLGGLSMLHRASPVIAKAADQRIQEWLDLR